MMNVHCSILIKWKIIKLRPYMFMWTKVCIVFICEVYIVNESLQSKLEYFCKSV